MSWIQKKRMIESGAKKEPSSYLTPRKNSIRIPRKFGQIRVESSPEPSNPWLSECPWTCLAGNEQKCL